MYDVSVVVLTYNPVMEKLKSTLLSVLNQKNVEIQIIISDDGSKIDFRKEIEELFFEFNFTHYKLFLNKENVGTIENYYFALEKTDSLLIKGISPGD